MDTDPLKWQPQSALVRCQPGERVLLRFANLGYQNHAMTMDNVPMRIVGKDALILPSNGTTAPYRYNYIDTNSVEVGPGKSRDVIFTAPAYKGGGGRAAGYDSYLLYDRNLAYADNAGNPRHPAECLRRFVCTRPGPFLPRPSQRLSEDTVISFNRLRFAGRGARWSRRVCSRPERPPPCSRPRAQRPRPSPAGTSRA